MPSKIARRRAETASANDSGREWREILRDMHAAGPSANTEVLRRRFIHFAVEFRRVTPEAAAEMWAALRRRRELLPQPPPQRPSSDE